MTLHISIKCTEFLKLDRRTFTDMAFVCGPTHVRVPAHRLVFGAHSESLKAMLQNPVSLESQSHVVELRDHDPDVVDTLLRLLYEGCVEIRTEQFSALYKLCHLYGMANVLPALDEAVAKGLTQSNALLFFTVGRTYSKPIELAVRKFLRKNANQFFSSRANMEANSLNAEEMRDLLADEFLYCPELVLLDFAKHWAHKQAATAVTSVLSTSPSSQAPDIDFDPFCLSAEPSHSSPRAPTGNDYNATYLSAFEQVLPSIRLDQLPDDAFANPNDFPVKTLMERLKARASLFLTPSRSILPTKPLHLVLVGPIRESFSRTYRVLVDGPSLMRKNSPTMTLDIPPFKFFLSFAHDPTSNSTKVMIESESFPLTYTARITMYDTDGKVLHKGSWSTAVALFKMTGVVNIRNPPNHSALVFEVSLRVVPEITATRVEATPRSGRAGSSLKEEHKFVLRVGNPVMLLAAPFTMFFKTEMEIVWRLAFASQTNKESQNGKEEDDVSGTQFRPSSYLNACFGRISLLKEVISSPSSSKHLVTVRALPKESLANPELGEEPTAQLFGKAQVIASATIDQEKQAITICPYADFVRCDGQMIFFVSLAAIEDGVAATRAFQLQLTSALAAARASPPKSALSEPASRLIAASSTQPQPVRSASRLASIFHRLK